jgi:hypothetical protein
VKAQQSAKEIETLGPAQARTFLKTKRGYRLEALYGLAVTTSMGQGELLRLRWEDKDLDVGAVQVRRTRWRMLTADFSVVNPQHMMCTYGPAQGFCSTTRTCMACVGQYQRNTLYLFCPK